MTRVAIVGGGITGLSAAYELTTAGIDFTLFEATSRLGGVIQTLARDGFLVEAGPDSFLTAKPATIELARELGIEDQLIGSNDDERKTYILRGNRLVPLPDGLQLMVPTNLWSAARSPLFSWRAKLRIAREYLFPPEPLAGGGDESVAAFTERHFGREAVERLAEPLLAGVYGGDVAKLSARAVLPNMVQLEAQYRSLIRGLMATRRRTSPGTPIFTSFRNGMQQLVDAITAKIDPAKIKLDAGVDSLAYSGGWQVRGETFSDAILALPAQRAAKLTWGFAPDLAALLNQIRYTHSITIALIDAEAPQMPGFGFLVPRSEGRQILACTFVQQKFPGRAPAGKQLLRVFLTTGAERTDADLGESVQRELSEILRGAVKVGEVRVHRWPNAMPQYEVGHLERVAAIGTATARYPGLQIVGNACHGIGISDCVREGRAAARRVASR